MANTRLELTGLKFGKLTARSIVSSKPSITWACECECGNTKTVRGSLLKNGSVKSCGCLLSLRSEFTKLPIGFVVGDWRCLSYVKTDNQGHHYMWSHKCGMVKRASFGNVNSGKIARCGCSPRVTVRSSIYHMPTRNTHKNMIVRCLNPEHVSYCNYGGRGITIDPRWIEYADFVFDMGERPEGTELDRIDNSKGYNKNNCRWTTRKENQRNTSGNRKFMYNGHELCVAEIAEIAHAPYARIYMRLTKYGYSVEEAVNGRSK